MLMSHHQNQASTAEFHLAQTMIRKTLSLVFPEGFAGIGMKAVGCVFDAPDHCLAHQEWGLTRRSFRPVLGLRWILVFWKLPKGFPRLRIHCLKGIAETRVEDLASCDQGYAEGAAMLVRLQVVGP